MDHEHMDHGHMGHGDMDMDMPMCNMNMIFTWDTTDLCLVFKWWHIRTTIGLWLSMLTVVALGAGYECLRNFSRRLEAEREIRLPTDNDDNQTSLDSQSSDLATAKRQKLIRSGLYAFQVAYSFFLMLIFMTYNGWAMVAVTAGAFLGHYLWGESSTRGMACH